MPEIERWASDQFPEVTYGNTPYVVVYEDVEENTDEEARLKFRERVPKEDFFDMFRDVIEDEEIQTRSQLVARLEEASKPDPDGETELERADWGYERIIEHWDQEGYLDDWPNEADDDRPGLP